MPSSMQSPAPRLRNAAISGALAAIFLCAGGWEAARAKCRPGTVADGNGHCLTVKSGTDYGSLKLYQLKAEKQCPPGTVKDGNGNCLSFKSGTDYGSLKGYTAKTQRQRSKRCPTC
jgi:hypothetical protein